MRSANKRPPPSPQMINVLANFVGNPIQRFEYAMLDDDEIKRVLLTDHVKQVGNFFGCGLMIKLLCETASSTQVSIDFLDDMNRQANGSSLIHDGTFNRLANPNEDRV